MKTLLSIPQSLYSSGLYTLNDPSVIAAENTFQFPANAAVNRLTSVRVKTESSIDDIRYIFSVTLSNLTAGSRIGLYMLAASDLNSGEKVGFVVTSTNIAFYAGDAFVENLATFNIGTLAGVLTRLEIRRVDTTYYFTVGDITVSKEIVRDGGAYYRQNISPSLYGNDVTAIVSRLYAGTDAQSPKYILLGDSIAGGLVSGTGSYADTIKGILKGERGISISEAAGSANIIKDGIDGFNDIAVLAPKYAIIMYGHNDLYFNTGRHITDYNKLVALVKQYGIIPIICAMPASSWVDITLVNSYLAKTYAPTHHFINLYPLLAYPGDYNNGPHPNPGGNRKLANAIGDYIAPLP